MMASLPLQRFDNLAEEDPAQTFRFEVLAGGLIRQRLRIAIPLRPPFAARTFDARATVCAEPFQENAPMSERIPVPAEVGGLADLLLSHLDSAYNLAHWLVRNGEDAEDVVQEAYLRAFQYPAGFRRGDARAWLLKIVRNTSYARLQKTRPHELVAPVDEEILPSRIGTSNPEELLLQNADGRLVEKALKELPILFREILILRELEDLSYKEIADVMGVPIGTVMSTLARARHRFRHSAGDLLKTHLSSESDSPAVQVGEYVGASPSHAVMHG
jgi:RNA polymerase sigma-70 factor (ECF subfamily)